MDFTIKIACSSWPQKSANRVQEVCFRCFYAGIMPTHQPINKPSSSTKSRKSKFGESSSAEEEFFCLTPEDSRSISSNTSERSRNASTTSSTHQIPDTKIFSVAVEAKVRFHLKNFSAVNFRYLITKYVRKLRILIWFQKLKLSLWPFLCMWVDYWSEIFASTY